MPTEMDTEKEEVRRAKPPMEDAAQGCPCTDIGLLVLRIGIGAAFLVHGVPKLMAGPDKWTGLGGAMGVFGITFAPQVWGFLAALAESLGGLLLLLGIAVRPAAFFLLVTMIVATGFLVSQDAGFAKVSHPLKMGFVFLFFLLAGGGKFSLGALLPPCRGRWFQ